MQKETSKRLKNRNDPVGIHSDFSIKGMFFFGFPFFAVGLFVILIGTEVIAVDPNTVHAPMWVLTTVGAVFLASGLLIWNMGWRHVSLIRRREKLSAKYPNDRAMADYPWERDQYSPLRWRPVRKALGMAVFFVVFASVFNWWAFGSGNSPLFLKLMIGLLDLIVLGVILYCIRTIWHALKFGKTSLKYPYFPIRLGDSVELEIQLPIGLSRAEGATLKLRCIKEFYEISGHGKNRNKRLVHEVLYESVSRLNRTQVEQWPGTLRYSFELPKEAPPTALSSEAPHFWEIELRMDVPGLDLEQRYLLPVY